MIPHRLSEFLRGANGGIELNRLLGALGGFAYIIGANAFTAWHILRGNDFDITAYCVAFPGGLGAILVAIGGAVAIKDRGVATAKVTESTARPGRDEAADAAGDVADAAADKADEFKPAQGKRNA